MSLRETARDSSRLGEETARNCARIRETARGDCASLRETARVCARLREETARVCARLRDRLLRSLHVALDATCRVYVVVRTECPFCRITRRVLCDVHIKYMTCHARIGQTS